MTSSKSTDIRATIVLDKHGHVNSLTSRCADIIGPGVDDFLKYQKFTDFLVDFSDEELVQGEYLAEFKRPDGRIVGVQLTIMLNLVEESGGLVIFLRPVDRFIFELVINEDGIILDMENELGEIIPELQDGVIEEIIEEDQIPFGDRNKRHPVTVKTRFGYSVKGALLLRGSFDREDGRVFMYDVEILKSISGSLRCDSRGKISKIEDPLKIHGFASDIFHEQDVMEAISFPEDSLYDTPAPKTRPFSPLAQRLRHRPKPFVKNYQKSNASGERLFSLAQEGIL